MKSSFFEFHVATSALFTAKAGLQVVSHNIANASTVGYSRQYAEQRASRPLATYSTKGMIGTGSEVYGVGQIRSLYLDKKYWAERGVLGEHTAKSQQLRMVETLFNEMSGSGIAANFDSFFSKMQDLVTNAPDGTYRNNAIKTAESLAQFVNGAATSLRNQQMDANTELSTVVKAVNNLGSQIANLNERISKFEIDGSRANDLRDQRAVLIDELSLYVNVEVEEREHNEDYAAGKYPNSQDRGKSDKRLYVMINGYEFINSWDVNLLDCVPRAAGSERNDMDAQGLYDLTFQNGVEFDLYSPTLKGELKGLIDVRDGNNGEIIPGEPTHKFKGIPYYLEQLNTLVRTFAKAINEGIDIHGNSIEGVTGHVDGYGKNSDVKSEIWFFNYKDDILGTEMDYLSGGNYADMNCFNFQVNSKLLGEPDLLACSDTLNSGESNNNVILGFGSLATYQSLFKEGKLSDFVNSIASELGVDTKQSINFTANYTDVTKSIDNQRMQVSGVSLNDEVLNMVQYQQQYTAAAKLVSVINDIYDVMINQMGR